MNTNDLTRLQTLTREHEETGTRLLLIRMNAALLWEMAKFIRTARRRSEVSAFIDALPVGAQERLATASKGIFAPGQSDFGRDLAHLRNHTFHYPEVGRPALERALHAAADVRGMLGGTIVEEFRFDFADEVALKLLTRSGQADEYALVRMLTEFQVRTASFRDFADEAIAHYLGPAVRDGRVRVLEDPPAS